MSWSHTSTRPPGSVKIPVQIISPSNSNYYSRHNSHDRPCHNESFYSDFCHTQPREKPTANYYSTTRLQPRHSPIPAYDRLIKNSKFNQPFNDRPLYQDPTYYHSQQRLYEPSPLHISHSTDNLLSFQLDPLRASTQSQTSPFYPPSFTNIFRPDSDFLQASEYSPSIYRSFDVLNDFPDIQNSPSTNRSHPSEQQQSYYRPNCGNSTEYRVPTNRQQSNTTESVISTSHDRSHSPASQCDESPIRPPPAQQPQESDFKVTKETTSPTPTSETIATSNDQQVPSTDLHPARDPNIIALEKLEQIKQNLADFNQQVDAFTGPTRDDRAYKELDEQALKMMIRCDELIDVSADIKEKRKEMICNVQTVLAKLESKVPINPPMEQNSNQMESSLSVYDPTIIKTVPKKEETPT